MSLNGALPPQGAWVKVVSGWGYFAVDYHVVVSVPAEFACYTGVWLAVWNSGRLVPPTQGAMRITHRVIVYGDVWLRSTAGPGSYSLAPINSLTVAAPSPLDGIKSHIRPSRVLQPRPVPEGLSMSSEY